MMKSDIHSIAFNILLRRLLQNYYISIEIKVVAIELLYMKLVSHLK